jgi:hypothetical protein
MELHYFIWSSFILYPASGPETFIYVMLLAMCFICQPIALSNSISFTAFKLNNKDLIKDFPPIRVWGTIGFIADVDYLTGNKATADINFISQVYLRFFLTLCVYFTKISQSDCLLKMPH